MWLSLDLADRVPQGSGMARLVPGGAEPALTRLVELPGRGTTRIWECAGPRGAETLLLIHGAAFTAELNWGKVFAPLARHFRVIAADQRGHGDGISAGSRFLLEDCADDMAALAAVLGIGRFIAVGYSMGGMIAQLLYRRHPSLLSGLVLCSTARNVRGSLAEQLAALALPAVATAVRWSPILHLAGAELIGLALLGRLEDPATGRWAREQLRLTTLATAVSAILAVSEFTSHDWIGQVDIPAAVVVTARDRIVPARRQRRLAQAIPGASAHELEADHGACINAPRLFAGALLEACWSVGSGRGNLAAPGGLQ
jgi:3-oxoadipate enol-lactonase